MRLGGVVEGEGQRKMTKYTFNLRKVVSVMQQMWFDF